MPLYNIESDPDLKCLSFEHRLKSLCDLFIFFHCELQWVLFSRLIHKIQWYWHRTLNVERPEMRFSPCLLESVACAYQSHRSPFFHTVWTIRQSSIFVPNNLSTFFCFNFNFCGFFLCSVICYFNSWRCILFRSKMCWGLLYSITVSCILCV